MIERMKNFIFDFASNIRKNAKNIPEYKGNLAWHIVHIKKETIKIWVVAIAIAFIWFRLSQNLTNDIPNSAPNGVPNDILRTISGTIGVSALVTAGSDVVATIVLFILGCFYETITKLTRNYEKVTEKYNGVSLITRNLGNKSILFPGEKIVFRTENSQPFHFEFDCSKRWNRYCIPEQVVDRSQELIRSYASSFVYNSQTVRLDYCMQSGNIVSLTYSMANYYDLLLTNRSMDYPLSLRGLHTMTSIRELYEPGPLLTPLSQSKLANHLGFNGFVALGEKREIIFVKRDKKVSIGKNVWGPSVNTSYKVEYGLDENRKMSEETMSNAIRQAIKNELHISESKSLISENGSAIQISLNHGRPLTNTIFAFYRDLVQGGKPHFVFYLEIPELTPAQFKKRFKEQEKSRLKLDFFTLEQLQESKIYPHKLVPKDRKPLKMQPFGTVPLALLLEHFQKTSQP